MWGMLSQWSSILTELTHRRELICSMRWSTCWIMTWLKLARVLGALRTYLVPKPDKSYWFVQTFVKLMLSPKLILICFLAMKISCYVSKFELLKGYWQVPLTDWAKEISAFVTPDGLFQYKVMPFRIQNAPATFHRLISHIIHDVPDCEAYINDVIIYSDCWEDHVKQIHTFFECLKAANLTINLSKSEFGHARVGISWTHHWSRLSGTYSCQNGSHHSLSQTKQ